MNPPAHRRTLRLAGRLALTTALGALVLGYGRRAYAGSCGPPGSIILCSGPADPDTDRAQSLYGPYGSLISVQTAPGFGLDTSRNASYPGGINIESSGGLSFDGSAAGLSIRSGATALRTYNFGSGAVSVDTRGGAITAGDLGNPVSAQSAIRASNSVPGSGLTIRTGNISATDIGILGLNSSAGDLIIDTTAASVVARGTAIYGGNLGSDVIIAAGAVSSSRGDGIFVQQAGTGAVSVTSGDVEGNRYGIRVKSDNNAPITIDSRSGQVAGATNTGIFVRGRNIDIRSAGSSGGIEGIFAESYAGTLSIDSSAGDVTGGRESGINIFHHGTDARLRTGNATGVTQGIYLFSDGSGAVTVDTTRGAVTGRTASGVRVIGSGTNMSVATGSVSGALTGIRVISSGTGATAIDSTGGSVTGVNSGIYALASGSSLALTTASVAGGTFGINTYNKGRGAITIDTTAGTVTGASRAGISVRNAATATDAGIRPGSVTAAEFAVLAVNLGTGSTAVDVPDGSVLAGGAGAIKVSHAGGGGFSIANAGELRRLADDPAALVVDAKSEGAAGGVSLTSTGRITGTISLTAKDDSFINDGTWNMAGGTSDFGAGNDRFENRSNLTFRAAADGTRAETTTLRDLESFRNSGTVTLADGGTGDTLLASGDFDGAGGTVILDTMADGSASDLLHITGNVVGGPTRLAINYLGPPGAIGAIGVPLVHVDGITADGDFTLADPVWDGFVYRLVLGSGNSWSVTPVFALARTLAALERDASVAGQLLDGQQAGLVNAMAQDCTRFGPGGACLSLSGRSTRLSKDQGSSDALVLTAAVQPRETSWRMGAFLDQRVAGELPDGFSFERMGPTLGGFAGYGTADGLGPRLRLSGAWSTAQVGIERPDVPGLIDGGQADAGFSGWGFGGEVGYGLALGKGLTLAPFTGLGRVVSTRGAYAEETGVSAYPLRAEEMSLSQTTLSAGATLDAGLSDAVSLQAGFGVEHDLTQTLDSFDGSFQDIGSFTIDPGSSWQRTRLFGGAGLDYALDSGVGLSLAASARQLPLDGAVDVTASAGLRASF